MPFCNAIPVGLAAPPGRRSRRPGGPAAHGPSGLPRLVRGRDGWAPSGLLRPTSTFLGSGVKGGPAPAPAAGGRRAVAWSTRFWVRLPPGPSLFGAGPHAPGLAVYSPVAVSLLVEPCSDRKSSLSRCGTFCRRHAALLHAGRLCSCSGSQEWLKRACLLSR